MRSEKKEVNMNIECKDECCKKCKCNHCGGAFYGLGFVGSAIYYISTASTFGMGVLGILKSIIWPAVLVFELFRYLNL